MLACAPAIAVALLNAPAATALPTFARQTGLPCNVCHNTFPELTSFGRQFKMNGYVMSSMKQIESSGGKEQPPVKLNATFPFSVMFQGALTRTDRGQPGTQNNNVQFPQQLSIFLAGAISSHVGAFVQATYTDEEDNLSLDNTDIRFANRGQIGGMNAVYGITVNNNPTVEDPWNSTPAWGFPFAAADSAPAPSAATLVDGTLAQQVTGLGTYSLWNEHLYAAISVYRSEHIGGPQPPTGVDGATIDDVAPYWRLAWQQNWGPSYLEVGTYGLYAKLYPESVSGATDKFTDVALDSQFEHRIGADLLTAHATYIYEDQNLDATHGAGNSENGSNNLHTFRLNGIYHFGDLVALSLGYFLIHGTSDAILYAPDPVDGSANGSPDSDGILVQVAYFPWQNIRLSAQYTVYSQFNGRAHNYDGSDRDAADNNTFYLLAWLNW